MIYMPLLIGTIILVLSYMFNYQYCLIVNIFVALLLNFMYGIYIFANVIVFYFPALYIKFTHEEICEDLLEKKSKVIRKMLLIVCGLFVYSLLVLYY